MPRVLLSPSEVEVIEQLRRDETKYNLGYNAGLDAALEVRQEVNDDLDAFYHEVNELRKTVKP